MVATIQSYTLHRLELPLARPIGDSQVCFDRHWMTIVELHTSDGLSGMGAELQQGMPTPALPQIEQQFRFSHWDTLKGAHPFQVALSQGRPRGGNVGGAPLPLAVETAAWDLAAKSQGLPLFRLLGGREPRVPAYASTLDFHLSDEDFRQRLLEFRGMGFEAVKIKVGHPELTWDLRRLALARDVFGADADLMVDANEAWSPKDALLRLAAYRDAGFGIYWIEDPITRRDYTGYRRLADELSSTRVNTGEYLGFTGKRKLLEAGAVDVVNIHGHISVSRAAAYLAGDYGIPISLGNSIFEIGVHLAASLPECLYLEFSDLAWNWLLQTPVVFENGMAIAPETPGHGLQLDPAALAEYSRPQ